MITIFIIAYSNRLNVSSNKASALLVCNLMVVFILLFITCYTSVLECYLAIKHLI